MASIRHKSNKWQARVKRCGIVAEKSFPTKPEAERWARQIEVKIELGEYEPISAVRALEPQIVIFRDVLDRYSNEVAPLHRSTTSKRNLQILIRDLGHLNLAQVEPKAIALWRDTKLQTIKPSSVNRLIGTLGSVINHARKEWQLPIDNPILNIKRPSSGQARSRRLVGDEEQRLLAALDDRYARLARFALATGMRRGEILGLEWKHIDKEKRTALLLQTKNGEARVIPLSSSAVSVLEEIGTAEVWPISGRVFDIHPIAFEKGWRRACRLSGIRDLRMHDLRHEAISRLFELGLNVMEVSAISGHKTLSQLKRYTHLDAEKLLPRLG